MATKIIMMFGVLLSISLPFINAVAIDNGIVGTPEVGCMDDRIMLSIQTEKDFAGRIYVKGSADDTMCAEFYATNTIPEAIFEVQMGMCGMKRTRQMDPAGMNMHLIIVVSFHPTFVTKVDRAYRVRCLYKSAPIMVTGVLDVSMIPTTPLEGAGGEATCAYSLHADSPDGSILRYATIGQKAFHVWECTMNGPQPQNYKILVHECVVSDEASKQMVPVVDLDGCVIDPILLGEITYDTDRARAYAPTHVYKYSDVSSIFFMCNIRICSKTHDDCGELTPPKCDQPVNRDVAQTLVNARQKLRAQRRELFASSQLRRKRSMADDIRQNLIDKRAKAEMDIAEDMLYISANNLTVSTEELAVLDVGMIDNIREQFRRDLASNSDDYSPSIDGNVVSVRMSEAQLSHQPKLMCMSAWMYGLTISATLLSLFVISLILTAAGAKWFDDLTSKSPSNSTNAFLNWYSLPWMAGGSWSPWSNSGPCSNGTMSSTATDVIQTQPPMPSEGFRM